VRDDESTRAETVQRVPNRSPMVDGECRSDGPPAAPQFADISDVLATLRALGADVLDVRANEAAEAGANTFCGRWRADRPVGTV
jgi:hypothetical protein